MTNLTMASFLESIPMFLRAAFPSCSYFPLIFESKHILNTANNCELWNFQNGIQILADGPNYEALDAVFPPHPESVFLSRLIPNPYGSNKFLDVGIGSGILSIVAAKKGWLCSGVDINERALKYSYINCLLNETKMDLYNDAFAVRQKKSDIQLCLANLPFEPTPEGAKNFLHSSAGMYGNEIVLQFIKHIDGLLASDGIAIMPAFALTRQGISLYEKYFQESTPSGHSVSIVKVSKEMDVRLLFNRYDTKFWMNSYAKLKKEGYKTFDIEIIFLRRKAVETAEYLGTIEILCADESWILPIGTDFMGKPKQQ